MKTPVLAQYGNFKVVRSHRLGTNWPKWVVRHGNKIVARHDLFTQAMQDAEKRNNDLWDEVGRQLKKGA